MVSLIREVALDESSIDEYLKVFETKIKEVDTSKAKQEKRYILTKLMLKQLQLDMMTIYNNLESDNIEHREKLVSFMQKLSAP